MISRGAVWGDGRDLAVALKPWRGSRRRPCEAVCCALRSHLMEHARCIGSPSS
ncbi:hypothetical protein [Lysobacter gummosus]|uniref:hypothetical protein n=1 Tax=Lysobacter gummosus TaxID=262324 RepID=UPI00363F8FEC